MKNFIFSIILFYSGLFAQGGYYLITSENEKILNQPDSILNKAKVIDTVFEKYLIQQSKKTEEYYSKNNSLDGYIQENRHIINYVNKIIRSEENNFVKKFAAFKLISCLIVKIENEDTSLANELINMIPQDDILFSFDHNSVFLYARVKTNVEFFRKIRFYKGTQYKSWTDLNAEEQKECKKVNKIVMRKTLEDFYKLNTNRMVKATALLFLLGDDLEDELRVKYYNILKNDFADIPNVLEEIKKYAPDSNTLIGASAPEFNAKLIGLDEVISSEMLKGRYYLVLFWESTCLNSVFMIEKLEKLFERYKHKNFTILSISIDDNDSLVYNFRKEKFAMQWYNIRLAEKYNSPLWKAFNNGEREVPSVFFISPDGKILGNNDTICTSSIDELIENNLSR